MHQYVLEDLEVYQLAVEIANEIWKDVGTWNSFAKYTLGEQLTKAADSISFNISEGYGRYSHKENIHFCYISRGSLFETITGIKKALNRNLISLVRFEYLFQKLNNLHLKLNAYIKHLKSVT